MCPAMAYSYWVHPASSYTDEMSYNTALSYCWDIMLTSSNGNIFRVTYPLCEEFTGNRWIPLTKFPSQRPVTRSFEALFDLRLNKRLGTQHRRWWFETPSHPSWRHCNVPKIFLFNSTWSAVWEGLSLSKMHLCRLCTMAYTI